MHRLTVLYGHPADPAEFDRYYAEDHIPLARKMQGLTGWTIGKVTTPDGSPGPYYMVASLYAESRSAMDAVLASPEGRAASDDVPRFATGGATFLSNDEVEVIPILTAATQREKR